MGEVFRLRFDQVAVVGVFVPVGLVSCRDESSRGVRTSAVGSMISSTRPYVRLPDRVSAR